MLHVVSIFAIGNDAEVQRETPTKVYHVGLSLSRPSFWPEGSKHPQENREEREVAD